MSVITNEADLERILGATRTIAVLGAHPAPAKPAHFVPDYLSKNGYTILPVNPDYPDELLWGLNPVATLADVDEAVEMVLVFRRPENLAGHAREILAMDPRPAYVWFQQGIRDDDVAGRLAAEGIDVVQDTCAMVMHKKRGLNDAVSL
ncbi:CoA-binding protein [soil metagenome]|nr:CoA-binding protein [Trueperaceae bacterium]